MPHAIVGACRVKNLEVNPLFIEQDRPWMDGCIESFNCRMFDKLLVGGIFYSLKESENLIEIWRRPKNTFRPQSALGDRPMAPAAFGVQPTQLHPLEQLSG